MKRLKRILLGLFGVIALFISGLYLTDTDYLLRAVRVTYLNGHKTAFIDDHPYFDNDEVAVGQAQEWPLHKAYNSVKPTDRLEKEHQKLGTAAFLIIKNDSIWYERYYDHYSDSSNTNSFSVAKSIVTSALGRAIKQGKIESLDTPVGSLLPGYTTEFARQLTVGHLASMTAGLDWDEAYYSPLSITTRAYFDSDLAELMLSLGIIKQPGQVFEYSSGSTQLLAMCIEKAVGMPLAKYVSQEFWKPMGAKHQAYWQKDSEEGMVKAYCCFATNARDFARFGKLYAHHGRWEGKQILDSAYVAKSTTPYLEASPEYGLGWWLFDYKGKKGYYMRGHLGQYVAVIPEDHLVMVRLGDHGNTKKEGEKHGTDFILYLDEMYNMLNATK